MQTGETLIAVKDLCKHFRDATVQALDGVDLTIRKGAALNAVQIAEELVRRDLLGVKDRTVFIKK